jgi:hypothetical protein
LSYPPRKITNEFLEAVEAGCYDMNDLVVAFCKYLSEDQIKDFIHTNELLITLSSDEE